MKMEEPQSEGKRCTSVDADGMKSDEALEKKMAVGIQPSAVGSKPDDSADPDAQNSEEKEEELEEGELKDDDDDDDDDHDEDVQANNDGKKTLSRDSSDESDFERRRRANRASSDSSNVSYPSAKPRISPSEATGGEVKQPKPRPPSTGSSSPNADQLNRPSSFRTRRESDSRHSSRSHSRSKRTRSPSNISQQARLITMRAKLLEAKSREIELKFQKNKSLLTSAPPISTATISLTPSRNLKTTIAKPPITYAENPHPADPSPDLRERSRSGRSSKKRSRSAKKSSKKRKKKTSSSSKKKKKKRKISKSPKKTESIEPKLEVQDDGELGLNTVDQLGPRTPPDNRVLSVDDEQVEWPSYLIKMTTTQPSISYSVNPDSVAPDQPDTVDLDADYDWYCNYFMDTYHMSKPQAQHQACSIIVSSGAYGDENVKRWVEHQGFSKQSDSRDELQRRDARGDSTRDGAKLPMRTNKPTFTVLKSLKDITLPNGMVLPRGTIQKIVHPYPRQERVIPELTSSFYDLH